MIKSRCTNILTTVILILILLGAGVITWAAPDAQDKSPEGFFVAQEPETKIEFALQTALETEGQASMFIVFPASPDLSQAYSMSWEARGKFVYDTLRQTAEQSQARVRAWLDAHDITYQSFIIDNSIYVPNAKLELANSLSAFSEVSTLRLERAYPVPDTRPKSGESLALAVEWGVSKINADDAWGLGYTGQGIVVSNIDTGVRYTHNALEGQYRGNLGGGNFNHTYSWYDPTGTYPSAPGDNHGHGTHTMGTIAGDDGGSNQIGVAPGAQWIACKGCTNVNCPDSYLNACADWILAPGGNSSMRPQVVNNSWGGCDYDNWYRSKVTAWEAAGIHPVFSAGNTSNCGYSSPFCGSIGTPGTYKESTAVGSTTSTDGISSFSLWGPSEDPTAPNEIKPEVSAPGSNIRSSYNSSDSSYATSSGTSMAAPHVSGALAVIWSACSDLIGDFDASEQLLIDSALQIAYATGCGNEGPGNIPNNAYGYGRIDVLAAVQACSEPVPTPTPGPSPTPTNTPTPTPIPPILLVDDDTGDSYQTYYIAALDALSKDYDVWTVTSQGSPSAATLQQYEIVIWFTGDDWTTTLTSTDQSNLSTYLNAGGNLFVTAQDIGYDIRTSAFYGNYLHASYVRDDTNTYGLTGYDIMSGVDITISGGDGANNQSYPSEISLGSGATGLYDYDGSYTWGGLLWEGAYKVVYFSFGFEAINSSADRISVMDEVLTWLEGGPPPPTPTPEPPTPTPEPPTPTSEPPTPTPEPPTPTPEPPTPTPEPPTPTSEPPTPTPEPPTPTPEPPTPTPEPGVDNFEAGVQTSVGASWTTVNLVNTYTSPVVVCAVNYDNNSTPVVVRVNNVTSTSFDVMLQGAGGSVVADDVHYVVMEEGVWTLPDGTAIEAARVTSDGTNHNGSWSYSLMEAYAYQNSYSSPVVLGQVMSYNDSDWSVFWSSTTSRSTPPSSSTCYVGKHVAEDSDTTRSTETLGVIVVETASGTVDGVDYQSFLGADTIRGVGNAPPYSYALSGFSSAPQVGLACQEAMDGPNGGWAVLYGATPLSASSVGLAIDEDQLYDSERNHITEQVGILIFETSVSLELTAQ